MSQVLETTGIVLGVLATAVGVVATVSQWTRTSRLRRDLAVLREAASSPLLTKDQVAVARSLHSQAVAGLVARDAVPARRSYPFLFTAAVVLSFAYAAGNGAPAAVRVAGSWWGTLSPDRGTVPIALFGTTFLAYAFMRLAGLVRARARVAAEFHDGHQSPLEVEFPVYLIFGDDDTPTRRAFFQTLLFAAPWIAAAYAVGLIVALNSAGGWSSRQVGLLVVTSAPVAAVIFGPPLLRIARPRLESNMRWTHPTPAAPEPPEPLLESSESSSESPEPATSSSEPPTSSEPPSRR